MLHVRNCGWIFVIVFFCHCACSNAQVSCQNQTNFDPYRTWWLEEKGTVSELRKVPLEVQDLSGSYLEPQNTQNHRATYTYVDIHTHIYIYFVISVRTHPHVVILDMFPPHHMREGSGKIRGSVRCETSCGARVASFAIAAWLS